MSMEWLCLGLFTGPSSGSHGRTRAAGCHDIDRGARGLGRADGLGLLADIDPTRSLVEHRRWVFPRLPRACLCRLAVVVSPRSHADDLAAPTGPRTPDRRLGAGFADGGRAA